MNYHEILTDYLKASEKDEAEKFFVMKTETAERIRCIQSELRNGNNHVKISFDFLTNSIDFCVEGYVFDNSVENLKIIFEAVDIFVIDALHDGRICIEMRILNACEII